MSGLSRTTESDAAELQFLRERKAKYMAGLGERFASEVTALAERDALQARLDRVKDTLKRYEREGYAFVRFYDDDQCASTAIWAVLREAGENA